MSFRGPFKRSLFGLDVHDPAGTSVVWVLFYQNVKQTKGGATLTVAIACDEFLHFIIFT